MEKNINFSTDIKSSEKNINLYELDTNFDRVNCFVNKTYLNNLSKYEVLSLQNNIRDEEIRDNIRLFKISKIIYNKKENMLDKLSNIFSAVFNINASIILIIDSDGIKNEIYLGVRRNDLNSDVNLAKEVVKKSFQGNFPGSELKNINNKAIESLLNNITTKSNNQNRVVSSVSSIPSLKSQSDDSFVQGLEKLIDSMRGQRFSAIFISDPISNEQLEIIKNGYESMYSELVPFAHTDINFSQSDSESLSNSLTEGMSESISESISNTQSYAKSDSNTKSENKGKNKGFGVVVANFGHSNTYSNAKTTSSSETKGRTNTSGKSTSKSTQETESISNTKTKGISFQIKTENKFIENILEQIEIHLKRLNECKNFGMWNCAAYFIADDSQIAKIASSNFKSLISGNLSYIENSSINTWGVNNDYLSEVTKYLKKLHHPIIGIDVNSERIDQYVTPGVLVSGKELPIQVNLPKKSISGLVITDMAEFGRNVIKYDNDVEDKINIGKIFHMGIAENVDVDIDLKSLGSHTFITGSTGTGKSNIIYKILDEVNKKNINFLVIEPAKGEYKDIFGGREDVNVFGTNPKFTPVLKINPFSFDEDIHILEHIDKLVEIFNACWPMYAAMPAVLREAIENSYQKCGWNLDYSICISEQKKFPTFNDLLCSLNVTIENSAYSEDLKNDYTGALCTRVKSLTNGLIGKVFSSQSIDDEVLFDQNTIIDLSRIGSTETKSLIMGILFIKLQEYRMVNKKCVNSKLEHLTVIEEAHNLLRKTSMIQSDESSNLQGKSVEMISNSIAEMRTYGEGFIISDQAPNLLDNSVIRNTNTKIILRLPDQDDRECVGRAAGLNIDQINEIPKLKTGVAVVYQNNWMEAVLCKINQFNKANPLKYEFDLNIDFEENKKLTGELLKILLNKRVSKKNRININCINIQSIERWILKKNFSNENKFILIENLNQFINTKNMDLWRQDKFDQLCDLINSIIDINKFIMCWDGVKDIDELTSKGIENIRYYIDLDENIEFEKSLIQCMLSSIAKNDNSFKKVYFNWVEANRITRGELR
ncbi:MAG: ATP-binding protein [Intestinibacter sp.]|uniref:ATP-binding protein n=1 Tax=Intestinibacter sp. TaxID=1965304 RepID=UPI002A7EE278|nr:ATP-binding protein [Intestinibacter sp.]MDY4575291.1 ATP-binding protein [Intestinibacter sp.]